MVLLTRVKDAEKIELLPSSLNIEHIQWNRALYIPCALPVYHFHLFSFSPSENKIAPSENENSSQPENRAGVESSSSLSAPATNSNDFNFNQFFYFILTRRTISMLMEGNSSSVGSCSDIGATGKALKIHPAKYTGPTPSVAPVSWAWGTKSPGAFPTPLPLWAASSRACQQECIGCWLVSFHTRP